MPNILGKHLKEFYWVYFPVFDVDTGERGNDGIVINRRRQFGPMTLSHWPIRSSRFVAFPKLGTVDCLNLNTGAVECVIDTPSGPLRVYSLHLTAVSSRERLMQIDRLLEFHQNVHTSGGAWTGDWIQADPSETQHFTDQDWSHGEVPPPMPMEAVVMGDFNSLPESNEYTRMVGDIDPCYGRIGHVDGFVDSCMAADHHFGERITWLPDPPNRSPGHGITLDYFFVDAELGRKVKRA